MNALFAKGRQGLCNGVFNLATDPMKAVLLTGGYVPALATHQYYSDVTPGSNALGTPQPITFISDTGGVYKGSNPTFTNVPVGQGVYIAIYKDTGTPATSPLFGLIDTATGLPVTSNGSSFSVTISWDATNGIVTI